VVYLYNALVQKKILLLTSLLVMAGILVSLVVATYMRNAVFKSPVTLWADTSSKSFNKRRTHENYGQALSTEGMYNDAIREFRTVLDLQDDGSVPPRDVYREIGVVSFRIGLIDDAISFWQTGLRYAPGDPSLLNNLSVAFIQQQRYDEAESAVRMALLADPNMPHLLNTMGEIMMARRKYQEAVTYFLAAIEKGPDVAARYWNAASAFEGTGRYDMAYEYASRYADKVPDIAARQRALQYMNQLQNLTRVKQMPK
jgi:tetratricopeptide (TPR) repeat protein